MISLTLKRNIAKIFLILVVTPMLFSATTVYGGGLGAPVPGGPVDPLTGQGVMDNLFGTQGANGLGGGGATGGTSITPPTPKATTVDSLNINMLTCAVDLGACIIVYAAYALFVKLPNWISYIVGVVANALFAYGLSSDTFNQPAFVNPGWVICRDIANTFFIFVLLYIAILTILGTLSGGIKKMLMSLIIVALFMNFSMYITRFVVDVGNVFAIEFYNQFDNDIGFHIDFPGIQEKDVASGFADSITSGTLDVVNAAVSNGLEDWTWIVLVFFITGALKIVFIFVFLAASFLMIGRVAMIWILMIVSPLAFFSYAVPGYQGYFKQWTTALVNQAVFPVIFFFFVYIAMMLSNATLHNVFDKLEKQGQGGTFFAVLLPLMIQFAIVAAFLLYGLTQAKKLAGDAGSKASGYLSTAAGAGMGVAAWSGRKAIGGSSSYFRNRLSEDKVKELQSSKTGRILLAGLDKAGAASYDVRNSKMVGKATGVAGINFGQGGGQGGYAKGLAEQDKQNLDTYKNLKDDGQKAKYIESLAGFGLMGKGPSNALDQDAQARRLLQSLPFNERMKLIENAPDEKTRNFLRRVNKGIGQEQSVEQHKEAHKNLAEKPKEQLKNLLSMRETKDSSGKVIKKGLSETEMKKVYKGLSESDRLEMESLAENDTDRNFLKDLRGKVHADMSERQRAGAKSEGKKFEREQIFHTQRTTIENHVNAYESAAADKKEEMKREVKQIMGDIDESMFSELDGELFTNELVASNLSVKQFNKIETGKNFHFSENQRNKIRSNLSPETRNALNLDPMEQARRVNLRPGETVTNAGVILPAGSQNPSNPT